MRTASARPLFAFLAAALILPGMTVQAESAPAPTDSEQSATTPETQASALGLLSAVNNGEINTGQLALSQATDARTKRYAQHMIDEHTKNNSKLGVWPVDARSAPAQAKTAEAERTLVVLKQAKGPTFDGAYLKTMVRDHQSALQILDSTLLPATRDPAVIAFLKTTRSHVQDHLQQAQQLLAEIDGKAEVR
ncbi:hypothetical protein C1922_14610 [Stenotrophomonas sp. ZAC14D2_NAIMI4_7]|uniref:DUF4142 domain-containing protein n=1 Tax=Stenotrophomonas sp. ZAC14D2_NAIMI4_7 TaxID=2072405 RepID=UPI000D542156|nr:DUF4142 domain-containing protein [Stenotrophomonas sp. ZAC14D2_NAIMI4_7]AWH18440.1 hypothetical protein C1922_14610 [Stenotrophomonas sp. ZAC14D2_NAIMI4_7]